MVSLLIYLFNQSIPAFIGVLLGILVIYLFISIGTFLLLGKIDEKKWKGFIPVYNIYCLYKIVNFTKYFLVGLVIFVFEKFIDTWLAILIGLKSDFGGAEKSIFITLLVLLIGSTVGLIYIYIRFCYRFNKVTRKPGYHGILLFLFFPFYILYCGCSKSISITKLSYLYKSKLSADEKEIIEFKNRYDGFAKVAFEKDEKMIQETIKSDGKAHIEIEVDEQDSEDDIFPYMEEKAELYRSSLPLVYELNFNKKYTEKNIEKYESDFLMRQRIEFKKKTDSANRTKTLALIFLLVGITLVITYIVLQYFEVAKILSEVLMIMGWVFVWEFVSRMAFDLPETNREIRKTVQIGTAEIISKSQKDK